MPGNRHICVNMSFCTIFFKKMQGYQLGLKARSLPERNPERNGTDRDRITFGSVPFRNTSTPRPRPIYGIDGGKHVFFNKNAPMQTHLRALTTGCPPCLTNPSAFGVVVGGKN